MIDEFELFRETPPGDNSPESIENKESDNENKTLLVEKKPIILLIDDDSNIRESIKFILEKNYEIITCSSGDEGIQKFNSDIYAVILDIKMQGKNGFETFIELKKKNVLVPIIFHSAFQDLKDPYEVLNFYRPFGYVIKEGDTNKLLHTLTSAVDYYLELNKNNFLLTEIQKLNFELEEKVKQRTSELNTTLTKLNASMDTIREDLALAKKIQKNTIFNNFSLIEELNIFPYYHPMSEVGGDFYDINKVNDFTYRIFLADATGHGVQGAMITMAIKGIYDNIKNFDMDVGEIMGVLNDEYILKYGSVKSLMTGIIMDINVKNHTLKYISAGHPPGVLLQKDRLIEINTKGRIIGVLNNLTYESIEYNFSPSDRLFIFTDGIYEQYNSKEEEFGEERLYSIFSENRHLSMEENVNKILKRLDQFIEGNEKEDDITVLGIEYK